MDTDLRFDVGTHPPEYSGRQDEFVFEQDRIWEFNHRHKAVLANYDIVLDACTIITLSDRINGRSNLGALRNRQLRQSVILSAGLAAVAVALHGRGSLTRVPKHHVTKELQNRLKRANDRTAAQVMAEVLQTTTETLPEGEQVLIESAITEGARIKPGKEPGGNPTIPVGAVFGLDRHRADYGLSMPRSVTQLSMGSDVIDGTTKSIKGLHSSLTALFITEANVKRHLPDIYVQRWMGGAFFPEFNPREAKLLEAADIIARAYGHSDIGRLSAFFLDRPRHETPISILNKAGISTPMDKDGDLLPGVILGIDGLKFSDGRGLTSMIGEIGGSAEWALGVLPLVWRGGQAIGMLTSQSSLTRKDHSPEDRWKERFHFTEEEFLLIQDARFERKPYFTIDDIIDDPFAGGVSAFGGITDNRYLPFMHGVETDANNQQITVSVLVINSLGTVECWQMAFKCNQNLEHTTNLVGSPKAQLAELNGSDLQRAIAGMLENEHMSRRFRIFFDNEYYPALIPVRDRIVLLQRAVRGLVERGVLDDRDREIIKAAQQYAPDWFINSDS
ncbi:MAG TPA: fructose-bisphosphatase class II [Acidobacteriota bacterium]|nr:fructose-bisphosphatase class II [Acidobacteriota bacterium]